MVVGEFSGEKVSDAKPKLKATLVAAGDGIIYSEPERAVRLEVGRHLRRRPD